MPLTNTLTARLLTSLLVSPILGITPLLPAQTRTSPVAQTTHSSVAQVSVAQASPPAAVQAGPTALDTLLVELLALPDHAARRGRLGEALSSPGWSPDQIAAIGQTLAVVSELERHQRTDPSIVRLFLSAALSPDPKVRSSAVTAAQQNGDPPLPGVSADGVAGSSPAEVPPSLSSAPPSSGEPTSPGTSPGASSLLPGAEKLDALKQYKSRRLVRGALSMVGVVGSQYGATAYSTVTWTVYDGGGAPFTAKAFAAKVGDQALQTRLEEESSQAIIGAVGLGVGGALVAGLSLNALANSSESSSSTVHAVALPGLILGVTALSVCYLPPMVVWKKQQHVSRYFTPEEIDPILLKHNKALAEELHLTPEDVSRFDLSSQRAPLLELHPWVSLSSVGISGRF